MNGWSIILLLGLFIAAFAWFWVLAEDEEDARKDIEDDLNGWWEYFNLEDVDGCDDERAFSDEEPLGKSVEQNKD